MKQLLLLAVILLASCGRSSDDGAVLNQSARDMDAALNKQKEMIVEIRTAETIDERISGLNKQQLTNSRVPPEDLAKSPESVRFLKLIARQNQLSTEFKQSLTNISEDIRLIENTDKTSDLQQITEMMSALPRFCRYLASTLPLKIELKNIMEEKVLLAREHSVIIELFKGERKVLDGIKYMLDDHKDILEKDAVIFKNFGCENRV